MLTALAIVLTSAWSPSAAAQALDCSGAFASPASLWPPNHKMQAVDIEGVAGADYIEVQCVSQDEPLNADGDGNTEWDADGVGDAQALVRSERQGGGNGRVYYIDFLAYGGGSQCYGQVQVGVPHSGKAGSKDDKKDKYCEDGKKGKYCDDEDKKDKYCEDGKKGKYCDDEDKKGKKDKKYEQCEDGKKGKWTSPDNQTLPSLTMRLPRRPLG